VSQKWLNRQWHTLKSYIFRFIMNRAKGESASLSAVL
jgi:hypothetical protein